jgi:hypothetical protein
MTRPSTAAPILAVLAIVLVTLGVYVGGYFWFGERIDWASESESGYDESASRFYEQKWMVKVFEPAARLETWLTGVKVSAEEYRDTAILYKT